MFEPQSYSEKRMRLAEITMLQLIERLAPVMGQDGQRMVQDYTQAELRLRSARAQEILGASELTEEQVISKDFSLAVGKLNLGRTYFNAKCEGSQLEGAIGTKSFGMRYKDWLNGLKPLNQVLAENTVPGFASYETFDPQGGSQLIPLLVLEGTLNGHRELHLVVLTATDVTVQSMAPEHLPETFSFDNPESFQFETYPYQGGLSRQDFLLSFAKALDAQYNTPVPFVVPQGLVTDAEIEFLGNNGITVEIAELAAAAATPSDEAVAEHAAAVAEEAASTETLVNQTLSAMAEPPAEVVVTDQLPESEAERTA